MNGFLAEKNEFAIVLRETGKVIGSIGFHESWANGDKNYQWLKSKQLGYVLSKDYWGQGLMPEAVKAVIRYCFDDCGVEALTCNHFAGNVRSRRVILKCGFTFIDTENFYAERLDRTFEKMRYILLR